MDTLLVTKLQFHTFCERQGWLLLFDKMTENKSEVGYMLQSGSTIFAVFDLDGNFDHINDNCNATLSVGTQEKTDDD